MELENALTASSESVRTARTTLQKLIEQDYDDAVITYKAFLTEVERCENQAAALSSAAQPMEKRANRYFSDWEKSLEAFANPRMRERSAARLEGTRSRYQAIIATLDMTHSKFASYNASLRDHALFLSLDFNVDSLADVREDVQTLRDQSFEVENAISSTSDAAEEYIRAAAPPSKESASR